MKRILALDGGGIRGALTARVLVELEQRLGPLATAFDLVAGTSTGGILACGIAAGVKASELLELYTHRGAEIFSRPFEWKIETGGGITGPKYPAAPIERVLHDVLGDATMLSAATRLLVPSYATELPRSARVGDAPEAGSYFFKSWQPPNVFLRDVARCTSAAPTFFPPYRLTNQMGEPGCYTDGGTFADSPGMCAYAEARKLWPAEELALIAIGTGVQQEAFPRMDHAGLVDWARVLISIFMDGQCDAVHYALGELLGDRYLRLDTPLGEASSDMDDVSPGNIARLVARAEALLADPAIGKRLNAFAAQRVLA